MIAIPSSYGSEAAILDRVIKPDEPSLPMTAARAILELKFNEDDHRRMHDLAIKNQEGTLKDDQRAELQAYLHVGLVLDLLRSKARLSLENASGR